MQLSIILNLARLQLMLKLGLQLLNMYNVVYPHSNKPIIVVQQINAVYLAGICTALTREENTHTINSNLRKIS